MTASAIDVPTERKSSASTQAGSNGESNLHALTTSQHSLTDLFRAHVPAVDEWLFGRDGSLTAIINGAWSSGTSLPTRAAAQMLKDFSLAGVIGCFLSPPHAAAVRVALDKLRANQAIIVVQPNVAEFAIAVRCEDFSSDIAAGRLWFVAGDRWAESLEKLFVEQPGLPTPGHFIRLAVSDAETVESLVADAQKVFAAENTRRAARVRALRDGWTSTVSSLGKLLVLKPKHFSLWNDAGSALAETLSSAGGNDAGLTTLELDDPRSASPLILAEQASAASALVAADVARADAPGVIADGMPWITWISKGIVPPAVTAGPNDCLLLADPAWRKLAAEAHWPADKVHVARWHKWASTSANSVARSGRSVLVIEDTIEIVAPENLDDYSSHRLLWDAIFQDLTRDPLTSGIRPAAYLSGKMRQAGIDSRGLDPAIFLDRLIYPAIQQSIAHALVSAGLPVQLHGEGWPDIEGFASLAAGPVRSRSGLADLVRNAGVIIYLAPDPDAHPLDAADVPLIRAAGKPVGAIVREAQAILNGGAGRKQPEFAVSDVLSLSKILSVAKHS